MYPPQQPQDPNRGLRQAGTVAIWVWVLVSLIPIVLIVGCVLMCLVGGVFSGLESSSS